jgi:hypothetical protein
MTNDEIRMTKRREEAPGARPGLGQNASIARHLFRISSFELRFSFVASSFVLRICRSAVLAIGCATAGGCVASHPGAPKVTDVDPKLAQPDYWWNQPGVVHVSAGDFHKLWDACKGELYVRLFPVDREQYRDGLLTSEPVVSKQFFELWRTDAVNLHDVAESSLGTIRRTIHFEVKRLPDGSYDMTPKVLVERFAATERRLTTSVQYHDAFSAPVSFMDAPDESGVPFATQYWYPLRRDHDLEKDMAESIRRRLGK